MKTRKKIIAVFAVAVAMAGCTVKAVGDPNRPITINANVVVDIRGLKQTATNIEDMVAQGAVK
jgi:nitrous oxide reductase accessory protein NosL